MAEVGEGKSQHIVENKIKVVTGPVDADDVYSLISSATEPIIFRNMIEHWKARQWTIDFFCKRYCDIKTKFKVCPLQKKEETRDTPLMETDCSYVEGRIGFFATWLKGKEEDGSPLNQFPRNEFSVYIDYKHMEKMFANDERRVLDDVNWEAFGFPGKNGSHSTIWIGSSHAFTPLHKDTYGCNLVAQLSGRKSWTLFSSGDTDKLYPIRIPYEESSIFSALDVENVDPAKHPKFVDAREYKVILEPGDVLFVPKHWWHYVKNVETSISVNMWITEANDPFDQIKEAVVRLLVCSLKGAECEDDKYWLNPNEEQMPVMTNLNYIKCAVDKFSSGSSQIDKEKKRALERCFQNSDFLINCLTCDKVVDTIVQEILSNYGLRT